MSEKTKKEHICTRMVNYIESKGFVIGKWESENGISNGYLRRSAKDGVNIGLDLLENFLSKFPDVDIKWLVTGIDDNQKSTENITQDKNIVASEKNELYEEIEDLKEIRRLQKFKIDTLMEELSKKDEEIQRLNKALNKKGGKASISDN